MDENDVKMHCNTGGKPCPLKDSDGVCTLLDDYCKKDVQNRLKTIRDWTEIILSDCRTAERDLNEIMDCLNSMIEEDE